MINSVIPTFIALFPLSRRPACWLLVFLLGMGSQQVAHSQTAPFGVNVTPAGPLTLSQTNPTQLLTAEVPPGFNGVVLATALQADGRMLVGGRFSAFNGIGCGNIVRLLSDGTLDTTFNPNGVFSDSVKTIVVQPIDQKILVGGYFRNFGTTPCGGVVRLGTDGTRDTGFILSTSMPTTGTPYVATIAVQSDGKVVVGGFNFRGNSASSLARYSSAGALDTNFLPIVAQGSTVTCIALLSNQPQSIVVGGIIAPTSASGLTSGNYTLLVLNSTGGYLMTFPTNLFTGEGSPAAYFAVTALAVTNLTNGSSSYNGSNLVVARRNTDIPTGPNSLYYIYLPPTTGFPGVAPVIRGAIGTGTLNNNHSIRALAFQSDGNILMGGSFLGSSSGGPTTLARLTVSGGGAILTQDLTFSAVPNGRVNALAVQSNTAGAVSSIAIGGNFTSVNGTSRNRAARLDGAGVLTATAPVVVTSYSWRRNGVPLIGETNITYTATIRGNYQATATVAGTTATSNTVVINDSRRLTISPPSVPGVPTTISGTWSTITVLPGGIGKLAGSVTVFDTVLVKRGGTLRLGPNLIASGAASSTFVIEPGATLSVSDPAGITTSGQTGAVRTATRSFADSSSYVYTGTANQFTGNGLPTVVRNLTDSTTRVGATLTLSAPTSVSEILTIASANDFNLNNQPLRLLSSDKGTALVVNSPTGRVTGGPATMERYIAPYPGSITAANPTGLGYRYYSAPLSGATATVGSLATAGFVPSVAPANVFSYNPTLLNTAASSITSGLVPVASLTDPLEAGKGYAVMLPGTAKVTFAGMLNTGPLDVALPNRSAGPRAARAGWNLVGNPYPAPFDWSLVAPGDRPNLDAAIYTYVSTGPNSGFYTAHVNGWGDGPVVAAGQSFFVRTSDTLTVPATVPMVKFKDSQRITSYGPQVAFNRVSGVGGTGVSMAFSRTGGPVGGGGGKPETSAYVDALAVPNAAGFSPTTDAYRIPSTNDLSLSISAPTQEDELAIKAFPAIVNGTLVPLTVRVAQAGTYTIAGITVRPPAGIMAFLDDNGSMTSVNLSNPPAGGPNYSFTLNAAQASAPIIGRFVLRFGPRVVSATNTQEAMRGIALYPNPARNQATVQIPAVPGVSQVQATLLNGLGQVVYRQEAPLAAAGTRLLLNVQGLAPGVYAVRLQMGGASTVQRLVIE